jgi:hypothetical protein
MQVNSMQDYVTMRKRQIIAKTFYSTPPEQRNKTNSLWLSTVGNNATVRQRFILPNPSAWGDAPGGPATFSNWCTGCSAASGAPGTFQTVNTKDVLNRQALQPIGVRATTVVS